MDPEEWRLRMMATERRHRHPEDDRMPPLLILALGIGILILIAAAWFAYQRATGPEPHVSPVAGQPHPLPTPSPTPTPAKNVKNADDDLLVSAARLVKPLEDIKKGDRVLYQGTVCTWQLWNRDINSSTIKCPGSKAFQIQTGRLTPVERKTAASKLKVRH